MNQELKTNRRIISLLMENEAGALSRVIGLFSQRGYNIDSLNVAPTEDSSLSRLTLSTECDDEKIQQITKQLHKLIDVIKVQEISGKKHVEREMMLVKVKAVKEVERAEIYRCVDVFRGQIVDMGATCYTIVVIGVSSKLDHFLEALSPFKVLEVARSGVSGLVRGENAMSV